MDLKKYMKKIGGVKRRAVPAEINLAPDCSVFGTSKLNMAERE